MTVAVRELKTENKKLAALPRKKEYSFEELAELNAASEDGTTYELSEGELITVCPSSPTQSDIVRELTLLLGTSLKANPLGQIYPDLGCILQALPKKTLRAPDIAYINREKIQANPLPKKGYWQIVPDLAIEVISPDDLFIEVFEKTEQYIRLGVTEVWLVIPPAEAVLIYRGKREMRTLVATENLESAILPGFNIPVSQLFEVGL